MTANKWLFVIEFRPIPTVRLSILTDSPNMMNPMVLVTKLCSFSFAIIRSIPIYINIIDDIMCKLIKLI